jgi:hypothetical protein
LKLTARRSAMVANTTQKTASNLAFEELSIWHLLNQVFLTKAAGNCSDNGRRVDDS